MGRRLTRLTGSQSGGVMQARVESFTLVGIEAVPVEVQVSVDNGYPVTTIVGLAGKAIRESLDRITAAFHGAGFGTPDRRVTVNLAPAELPKEGSALDLAIALGMLAALGVFPARSLDGIAVAGELSLNGEVRPVRGALAMALAASRLRRRGRSSSPRANLAEARRWSGCGVPGAVAGGDRGAAAGRPMGRRRRGAGRQPAPARCGPPWLPARPAAYRCPMDQLCLRRNPTSPRDDYSRGAGSRRSARWRWRRPVGTTFSSAARPGRARPSSRSGSPGILPPLGREESLEVTLVHSVAGLLRPGSGRLAAPPFRAPHHTVSGPGLVGGGAIPRPGEVSLAHGGVLFLDEMPEFRAQVLNLLRQPLEEGTVRVVRVGRTVSFPVPVHAGRRDESVSVRVPRAIRGSRASARRGRCSCTGRG